MAPQAAAPSLSSRPDPYSQIHNPLNVGWGTTPAPGPTPEVTPPTVALPTPVRTRSGWVRRLLPVLVLVALAALAWWQRDWISDTVDGVLDDSSEQGAAPSATPASNGPAALVDPTEVTSIALADLRAAAERADAPGIATAQQQLDRADEQLDGLQERYGDRSILLR